MGITGLLPFLEKASRKTNVSEFSGCTVAIDSYCWLHKGAFACAEKLVRGEDTDIHIKYCLKYVTMLLSRNIKPILVFDGRHLPAKAMTELKRRETRTTAKKRAAELLRLGQIDEARSFMRRSVDITHAMALALMQECRKRGVDCIVAPYEADSQLAYLNVNNYAQLVITEDSDLILFGCTKVLFKMDLDGSGTLVESSKLPLVMKSPIERYSFDKFRQMCIMSGCDYLASLPGIGLAKARQFVVSTQDSNFANALKKLPSFFNKSQLVVTDEYRENFLKAEATFKHQFVYEPIERQLRRLTDPYDEGTEIELCCNAGEELDEKVAFQLALGNLDPFTLKQMDNWSPDEIKLTAEKVKTDSWKQTAVSTHPSIWHRSFSKYLTEDFPWRKKPEKKPEPIISAPTVRARSKVVNLIRKYVPETQDDSQLTIENLSNMYCIEPANKRYKNDTQVQNTLDIIENSENPLNSNICDSIDLTGTSPSKDNNRKSPILENRDISFKKSMKKNSFSVLKKLSKFPRTVMDSERIESKFFSSPDSGFSENPISDSSLPNSQKENFTEEEKPFDLDRKDISIKKAVVLDNIDNNSLNMDRILKVNTSVLDRLSPVDNIQYPPIFNDKTSALDKNSTEIELVSPILNRKVLIEKSPVLESPQQKSSRNPFKKLNSTLKITKAVDNVETDLITPKTNEITSKTNEVTSETNIITIKADVILPETKLITSKTDLITSKTEESWSQVSFVENTYPVDDYLKKHFSKTTTNISTEWKSKMDPKASLSQQTQNQNNIKKQSCKVSGLKKKSMTVPSNQPTLLSKFGFQKKAVLKP